MASRVAVSQPRSTHHTSQPEDQHCACQAQHCPKTCTGSWLISMEASGLSLQCEVLEHAGSHVHTGWHPCPLQPAARSTKTEYGGSRVRPGRQQGALAWAAGLPGAFLGIAMAHDSKPALGFQDWALIPSCLMKSSAPCSKNSSRAQGNFSFKGTPGYYSDIIK